ncbi:MAG: hypothetical protein Q9181_004340 [Wetmoreana brouardii]
MSLPSTNSLELDRYQSLQHLGLIGCFNPDTILNTYHHPTITSFIVELNGHTNDEPSEMTIVNHFLLRFRSLKHLMIDAFTEDCEPQDLTAAVTNHADSLESLFINYMDFECSSPDLTRMIYLHCKKLAQLVTHAEQHPVIQHRKQLLLDQCLTLTNDLPQLVTLNIIKNGCVLKLEDYVSIAKQLFNTITPGAKLSLLVFGEEYHYDSGLEQVSNSKRDTRWCFFRDRNSTEPIQMKVSEAKELVAESDLLDRTLTYCS